MMTNLSKHECKHGIFKKLHCQKCENEIYPKDFDRKAEYKLANLMKHGYKLTTRESGIRVNKNNDDLLILANGEVFKKVIY